MRSTASKQRPVWPPAGSSGATGPQEAEAHLLGVGGSPVRALSPAGPAAASPSPLLTEGTGSRRLAEGLDVHDATRDKPALLQLSYRRARQDGPHRHLKPDSIRPCA